MVLHKLNEDVMDTRLTATRYIWIAYTLTMIALFLSTGINNNPLGAGHVVIVLGASLMAFLSTGTIWNWGSVDTAEALMKMDDAQKRKNQAKLESIVTRLSAEERLALRERLADEIAQYDISDDGEIVPLESKLRR
jgi:hypothetical protein